MKLETISPGFSETATPLPAKSYLGNLLPIWDARGSVIIALRGYFDGSGGSGPYRTLGGIAATDEVWAEFDQRWKDILTSGPISAAYLHMREAAHQIKEFDRKRGWDDEKVYRLIFDLLLYLQDLPANQFASFACSVDEPARAKLSSEGLDIPTVERICTFECCEMAWMWHVDKYPGLVTSTHYFFDREEPYQPSFQEQWNENANSNDPFWRLVQMAAPVEMRKTPGLQGADLIAWAVNRSLSPGVKTLGYLDEQIQGVSTHRRSIWDEAALRRKYQRVVS
jgi:hypothetical protein